MKDDRKRWKNIIAANGISVSESEFERLNHYHDLLVEWNRKVNLVSRKDEANIWPNHILHSISLLFSISIPDGAVVADIGSGGGLPGVPLAIFLPSVNIVMIESIKKKCIALTDIVSRLGIKNARVVNDRVESIAASKEFSQSIDIVFARAVASLKELVVWSKPLVRNHPGFQIKMQSRSQETGKAIFAPCLVAMKGGDISNEIIDAKISAQKIVVRDLEFHGIEKTGLVDKKIVIVSL